MNNIAKEHVESHKNRVFGTDISRFTAVMFKTSSNNSYSIYFQIKIFFLEKQKLSINTNITPRTILHNRICNCINLFIYTSNL